VGGGISMIKWKYNWLLFYWMYRDDKESMLFTLNRLKSDPCVRIECIIKGELIDIIKET
jgi:hypothetical protein